MFLVTEVVSMLYPHSRSALFLVQLVVSGLVLTQHPAAAQIVSGAMVGVVTDTSQAVLPGATVTATNTSTGLARTTQTDPQGSYAFPQLPPGPYNLSVSAEGFKRFEVTGVILLVEQTARVDATLEIGAVTEQIEVVAAGAIVQSETSSVGQVIDRERIVELPLNGRNFVQLANISAGAAPAYNGRSATITNQSGRPDMATHISGGRGDANSFLIDGVESRNSWFNSPAILLSVDAIQEFKVDRNMFAAEYGQGSGIVSLVSKTGGNEIHGSAFEFLRNDSLDAANYFDNFFGNTKAPFRQNQFGATVGGPIIKNKLFFFGNWESLRKPPQQHVAGARPDAGSIGRRLERAAASAGPLTAHALRQTTASRPTSSRYRHAELHRIHANAQRQYVGGSNFVTTKSTDRDDDQWGVRIDYQVSEDDSIFVRYTDSDSEALPSWNRRARRKRVPLRRLHAGLAVDAHLFADIPEHDEGQLHEIGSLQFAWEITETSLANEIGIKINQVPEEYGLPSRRCSGRVLRRRRDGHQPGHRGRSVPDQRHRKLGARKAHDQGRRRHPSRLPNATSGSVEQRLFHFRRPLLEARARRLPARLYVGAECADGPGPGALALPVLQPLPRRRLQGHILD